MLAKRSGQAPVDQEGEAEAVAGLRLFVGGGEAGLDPNKATPSPLHRRAKD